MDSENADLSALAERLVADEVASAVVIAGSVQTDDHWSRVMACAGHLSRAQHDVPTNEETFFDLASVTKPIAALTVARLARAGELDYQEPLRAFLPELGDTPAASATIEILLAHRAGLEGHRPLYAPLVHGLPVDRRSAMLEAAGARRSECPGEPPAHGFPPVYSDLGYLLLGEAIAHRMRRPLADLVAEHVLSPLGLEAGVGTAEQLRQKYEDFERRTAATELIPWRGGIVRGAVHDENAWAMSGFGMSGHAGLFGRPLPVVQLGEVILDVFAGARPQFLSPRELDVLVAPRPGGTLRAGFDGRSSEGSSTGSHWGPRTVGHLGFTGTSLWVDPDARLVGVLLTNRVHPARDSNRIRQARPAVYDALAHWGTGMRLLNRGERPVRK